MTTRRSPFLPGVLALLTIVAANACGGSTSGDDDSAGSGGSQGTILGAGKGGGDANGGGTKATGTGGTTGGGTTDGGTTGGGTTGGGTTGGGTKATGTGGGSAAGRAGSGVATGGGSSGGGAGDPGAGGSGGGTGTGTLGGACTGDGDCASGLVCVTNDSDALAGAAAPGGLCTLPCTSDAQCGDFASGAYCVAFDANATATYCLEGCELGGLGVPKCHERTDFTCSLIGFDDSSTACQTTDDCPTGQLCDTDSGLCADPVTGCLPACRGDFDCGAGESCDFLSGLCTPGTVAGDAIGAACDPQSTTDTCNGFCIAVDDAGTIGMCSGFCSLNGDLVGCGFDGQSDAPDGACLYATLLSDPADLAAGDVGLCGALCDCNDDCGVESTYCIDDTQGNLKQLTNRAGHCRPLAAGETEADTIPCN